MLSSHVFFQPCRDFRVDIFSWFSSLAHSILLESTHYPTALHQPLAEMLQPGRCHLPTAPKILALWFQSLIGPLCSPDSHISTYAFWHDSLLPDGRLHYWLSVFDLTSGRLTVPSEPSSVANTVIILTIDLAASSGRHTRQRHASRSPTTSSRSPLPPSALQSRLHGASHLNKDSEHHHRVEHHFTPPTRSSSSASLSARVRPFQPLPAHRPRPTLVIIRRDTPIAGLSRARLLATDIKTHGHSHFILCFIHICISRKHDLCIYLAM